MRERKERFLGNTNQSPTKSTIQIKRVEIILLEISKKCFEIWQTQLICNLPMKLLRNSHLHEFPMPDCVHEIEVLKCTLENCHSQRTYKEGYEDETKGTKMNRCNVKQE